MYLIPFLRNKHDFENLCKRIRVKNALYLWISIRLLGLLKTIDSSFQFFDHFSKCYAFQ